MLKLVVSPSRPHLQAGILLISLLSCSATLWLTLSFCWHLWPPEKRPLAVLIGVLWELAKLIFMAQGLHQARCGTATQKFGGLLLIAVSILASAGSVGAAAGFMQQRHASDQQQALTSSRQYSSAQVDMAALDEHIALLTDAARRETAQNFLTRAQKTSAAITALREQRQRIAAALESLEVKAAEQTPETSTRVLSPALLHIFVSVMLEMFGFGAMLMLHSDTSAARVSPRAGSSAAPPRRHIYQPSQRAQALLATLNGSRRYRACRDLLHVLGQHCLHIGRGDGMLTTAEIRNDLCEGMDWRTVRGYLRLLVNAGVLLSADKTRLCIADFANSAAPRNKGCTGTLQSLWGPQASLLPFQQACN